MIDADELLFMETEDLLSAMRGCSEIANREYAHKVADDILVLALLRAADDDGMTPAIARAFVDAYQGLDRFYG